MKESPLQHKAENGVWCAIEGQWRRVHGSFSELGFSIEWHDFRLSQSLDWASSFHRHSLEVCLNFTGPARLGAGKQSQPIADGQVALYTTLSEALPATRDKGGTHRFLTFEFSREFLLRQLETVMDEVDLPVRRWLDEKAASPCLIEVSDIPAHLLMTRYHVLQPPVPDSAVPLWLEGKMLELLASLIFRTNKSPELFCVKHQRLNREMVAGIIHLLRKDMHNPPSLDMLAREFGRSPFHLSRVFSEVTGSTIPAVLRKIRMERAACLLRDSGKSITEIAFEVGYSSLGAFNRAFQEQFQTNPSEYRNQRRGQAAGSPPGGVESAQPGAIGPWLE
jgi:AraC-like DNA-binding protein